MQFSAFGLYLLFITKPHIITTYIFVYCWQVNSLICVLCFRAALQTCMEVSEILRQFHEGKIGGEVFDLLLNQTLLNSCCKPCCLCWLKCSSKAATTLRCSWRTNLEVHWALARESGSRQTERGWKPCSSVASAVSRTLLDIFSAHPHSNLWVPHSKINRNRQVSSRWDLRRTGCYLHQPESVCFMQLINV